MKNDIGIIGMRVMGSNLALNISDYNYNVSIYNRTYEVGLEVINNNKDKSLFLYKELKEFVKSLKHPRKIILMVQAGKAVDYVINDLLEFLEPGDIIIDGGNSYFQDSIKRYNDLKKKDIHFLGVGISGGEEGARFGPAIMPGGNLNAYKEVEEIFNKIAAKADDGIPCVNYIGEDGSGHFVKMVHNGIEYADMQLISESYMLLKHIGKLSNKELSHVFDNWNNSELESYLIEITALIFNTKDNLTNNDLIDMILDKAEQKGTGMWTTIEALNTQTDASLLASSVFQRFMSFNKDERIEASSKLIYKSKDLNIDKEELILKIKNALYVSKIIAYAQGFDLMKNASIIHNWNLNFEEIAKIFRAGCIIRAKFLNEISKAYNKDKNLVNLLLDESFNKIIINNQQDLRDVVSYAVQMGISIPSFMAAISYLDAYRTSNSGANLIQAQRDLFGAHTFKRIDKEGMFHFDWYNDLKS